MCSYCNKSEKVSWCVMPGTSEIWKYIWYNSFEYLILSIFLGFSGDSHYNTNLTKRTWKWSLNYKHFFSVWRGTSKSQIMSMMSLSTKEGHPEVNKCKKSKLKFLVPLSLSLLLVILSKNPCSQRDLGKYQFLTSFTVEFLWNLPYHMEIHINDFIYEDIWCIFTNLDQWILV